jgi:hypothetical protein
MTVIAAISAAIAAMANVWTARRARLENQTEIFFFFRDRYTSREMNEALNLLGDWRKAHGEKFLSRWISEMESTTEMGQRLNRARRHVSRYFIDVARLYRAGFISRKLARIVTANNGFNTLIEVCEPMSKYAETHYSLEYALVLRRIRRRYKSGDLD